MSIKRGDMKIGVYFELAVVILLWGLVPLVMKTTALKMQPATFNFLRFVLSTLLLGAIYYRDLKQQGGRNVAMLMSLGALTLFPFGYFFLVGVKYVDISIAGMIQGTIPAMTVILSALLNRSLPTRTSLLSVGIAYCGLLLFITHGTHDSLNTSFRQELGIMYLALAMACFSLYTILSKRIQNEVRNSVVVFYASFGAVVGSFPVSVYEYVYTPRYSISWTGIFGIAYMALFATATSFILYTKAVRSIGPFTASIFTNFVPIVIIISGVIALGEKLNTVQIFAMCVVVVGVVMSILHERHSNIANAIARSAS